MITSHVRDWHAIHIFWRQPLVVFTFTANLLLTSANKKKRKKRIKRRPETWSVHYTPRFIELIDSL